MRDVDWVTVAEIVACLVLVAIFAVAAVAYFAACEASSLGTVC